MTTSDEFDAHDAAILRLATDELRALLLDILEPCSYPFGTAIVREGEPSGEVHILLSGRVRSVRVGDDGEEFTVLTLGPGESFGERAVVTGGPSAETIRASSEVKTLKLDGRVFRALLTILPELRNDVDAELRRPRRARSARAALTLRHCFRRVTDRCWSRRWSPCVSARTRSWSTRATRQAGCGWLWKAD